MFSEGKPPEQGDDNGEKVGNLIEENKSIFNNFQQEAPILRPDNEAKDLPLNTLGNQTSREQQNTKEKLGHRRIDEQGGVSYKKVPTNALMQAIQLGISNSIGKNRFCELKKKLKSCFFRKSGVSSKSRCSSTRF